MYKNVLKEKLTCGELTLGLFVPFYAPSLVEIIGHVGLNFLIIDNEHGASIMFPVFLGLTSLFIFLMGMTLSPLMLNLYRFGLGIGEGPLGIGCTNIINHWFPPQAKGTDMGIWISVYKFGPALVPIVGAIIIQMYGWRETYFLI